MAWFPALVLVVSVGVVACAETEDGGVGPAGSGGSAAAGGAGAQPPECVVDSDCSQSGSPQECVRGRCLFCPHGDIFSFFTDTPEFWNAEAFVSGASLGFDEQYAYWLIPPDELFDILPDGVFVCEPLRVEGGQPLETENGCEEVELLPVIDADEDDVVAIPLAPATWLDTGPTDGIYYTQLLIDYTMPRYYCGGF